VSAEAPIRLLSVDDHPLMREGIAAILRHQPDMRLVAEAANGREALERFREHQPDVTLMDLRLPGMSGIDALIAIRAEFPAARVVMLTTFEGDVEIQRALQAGARGYLLKTMPPGDLLAGIREVHAGRKHIPTAIAAHIAERMGDETLTARELAVLEQLAAGHRNRDIALRLFISEETVKVHVKHIFEKLAAKDRTAAVAIALRRGVIHLPGGG
jgi:DNA-binding NarL/FixJ family response regulator